MVDRINMPKRKPRRKMGRKPLPVHLKRKKKQRVAVCFNDIDWVMLKDDLMKFREARENPNATAADLLYYAWMTYPR